MRALVVASIVLAFPAAGSAQLLQTMQVFETRCAQCHGAGAAERRTPDRAALSMLTPERIFESLTTGSMAVNATGLSDAVKRGLSEMLSGRTFGSSASGRASTMKNPCSARPAFNPLAGPRWSGWGNDLMN